MKKSAMLLLLSGVVCCYSFGCRTAASLIQNSDPGVTANEPTIYLCVNTQPPTPYTDMIDFKRAERIANFTHLSTGEMWFGASEISKNLYRSKDGGATWKGVKIPGAENISAFDFIDSQNGILADEKYNLWKTADGGDNWDKSYALKLSADAENAPPPNEIKFSTIKDGLLSYADKNVYETSDGGKSWRAVKIPRSADRIIYSSLNNAAWIAFGKNSSEMSMLRKEDAGWKLHKISNALNYSDPESIFFLDEKSGWISSDMGEVFATKDGGINWEKLNLSGNKIFVKSIFWSDLQNGWLAGSDDKKQALLLATSDGGKNWNAVQTKDEGFFSRIFFTNQNDGWLVSRETIYQTKDGGRNWKPITAVSLSCQ